MISSMDIHLINLKKVDTELIYDLKVYQVKYLYQPSGGNNKRISKSKDSVKINTFITIHQTENTYNSNEWQIYDWKHAVVNENKRKIAHDTSK